MAPAAFTIIDLGRMSYAQALGEQRRHHAEVLANRELIPASLSAGHLLLVEHDPPVITITARAAAGGSLLATTAELAGHGIEVSETDRGGDITYHGPGQLVMYPIVDLNLLKLGLHDYMRALEDAVIDTLAEFGIQGHRDPPPNKATGVWVAGSNHSSAKICAMGVRVRRWITMHGLALNVTTNLAHFGLIVPCGLPGRPVTSMAAELAPERPPSMSEVKRVLAETLSASLLRKVSGSTAAESI